MGTISEKLVYLNDTKTALKDRLISLGATITNSTTFRNYINWLDNFYIGSTNKTDLAKNGIIGRTSQSGTPSPDSPQPINNLTGNVSYKVSGTNLFNKDTTVNGYVDASGNIISSTGYKTSDYIELKPDTSYYKSQSGSTHWKYYDENKVVYSSAESDLTSPSNAQIFTTPSNVKYLRFTMSDNLVDSFMLHEGSAWNPKYEPYIEPRIFIIPLGNIKLNGIDTYKDKLYLSNNKFYIEKKIGVHILNGSENWIFNATYSTPTSRSVVSTTTYSDFDYSQKYYSNRFVYNDTSTSNRLVFNGYPRIYVSLDDTLTGISTSDTNAQKITKMKTYMSNNNIEVYYVLKTPTTTEITSSNYPELYSALKEIQDYLVSYKINKEFLLDYSSPEIEY